MAEEMDQDSTGRESWMTALPSKRGLISGADQAAKAASGDMAAMKGRTFSMRSQPVADADTTWTESPAERQRKALEAQAIKQAHQAIVSRNRYISLFEF
jgi:hypothetical protein